jgi:hypothetical protein
MDLNFLAWICSIMFACISVTVIMYMYYEKRNEKQVRLLEDLVYHNDYETREEVRKYLDEECD